MTYRNMQQDYVHILKSALEKKCESNAQYSLRAFSRDVGLDPAQLSRVLNGKRHLSPDSARVVAHHLFEKKKDIDLFIALVNYASARNEKAKQIALKALEQFSDSISPEINLQMDAMKMISEWHHVALIEAITIPSLKQSLSKMAGYLGITVTQTKLALDRLVNLGVLEVLDGKYRQTASHFVSPSGTPSESIRKFHRQMIQKALKALESDPVEERFIASKTIAASPGDLAEIRELIQECNRKIEEKLSSPSQEKTDVFQINFQVFNLGKPIQKRKNS